MQGESLKCTDAWGHSSFNCLELKCTKIEFMAEDLSGDIECLSETTE